MKRYTIQHVFVWLCLITYATIGFAHKPSRTAIGGTMIVAGVLCLILSYGAYYNHKRYDYDLYDS